ncbi:S8 family serine peptidase [Pseudoalteromonas denitrificans]|uniref:Serine protease n=1 Tax=Pseudoalteromonas denitrificans DSM 6059 TaxID=1123010 RepID=A0A1I1UVQ6_9GAMM|nr:S8 family serine peptidase [Pseudoalteromonas denitrificans]SFD72090.1 serine protease [Pseudoalteromonas denitrificans DSM 6059]
MLSKKLLALAISGCIGTATAGDIADYHSASEDLAIKDRYIVVYKAPSLSILNNQVELQNFTTTTTNNLSNQFNIKVQSQYTTALQGALVTANKNQIKALLTHPSVDYIEQDSVITVNPVSGTAQNNPTWGLDRIDQRNLPLDNTYAPTKLGTGVTAYVIDTGVNLTHSEFTGRISSGYDFIDHDKDASDCNGHGTHVAGTIAGSTYGVAKNANIVGVRVLNCTGSGSTSGVVDGIEWVANNARGASVANMSLGGGKSTVLNSAVAGAVNKGIAFVVAAGNDRGNACNKSPASEPLAITVGSTTNTDARSGFSNYGNCLDIFAPGSNIKSAWIGGNNATNTISGTSMAAPHVAGAVALYLDENANLSPAQIANKLAADATPNVVSDPKTGSPNRLVYTEGEGAPGDGLKVTLSGAKNSDSAYTYDVPAGTAKLTVKLTGGSGDADLYIKHGITPLPFDSDCASETQGNSETCIINNPKAGTWHISVYGYQAFSNVTLTAN